MNATITPEERKLIDEALKAGKAQSIPQGKSGFEGWIWSEKEQKLIGVNPEQTSWKNRYSRFSPANKGKTAPHVAKRRLKVLELATEGLTNPQIAAVLGEKATLVEKDIQALRKRGAVIPNRRGKQLFPEVEARRAKIRAAFDGKRTTYQIAAHIGEDPRTVQGDLRRMGLKPPQFAPGPRMEARRDKVAEMHAKGMSAAAIGRELGFSPETIINDGKHRGLSFAKGRKLEAAE